MAKFTLPINSRVTEGKTFKPAVEPENKLRVDVYRYNPDFISFHYCFHSSWAIDGSCSGYLF